MNALNINSSQSPTKFLQPANLTTYTILSLFSLQVELAPCLLSPYNSTIRIFLITSHQSLFHICITLHMESPPFFIPSTSFCSLSFWFTLSCAYQLISHLLRSHHLSLPRPFTPDVKLIYFTNPFLHSHSYSFWTAFAYLNLYCIKGTLLCLFSLATCARLS